MSTAADLITIVKNFDISKVTYGTVKANKNGKGKSGGIYYGGKKLLLQIPLVFTWGASEMVDEETGKKSYSVAIPIKNDKSEASYPIYAAMNAIQKKVLDDASSYSKEWFGKAMSRDVAEALFTPLIKYPKVSKTDASPDLTKTPSLKTKIQFWEDKFTIEIYNMDKEQLFGPQNQDSDPISLMPQGTYMAGLIECGGLWFTGTGFGVTWKLIQAKIRPPVKITGFSLVEDDEEEEQLRKIEERERKEQEKEKQQQQTEEPEPHPTMIDDDEQTAAAPDEPAPAPAAPPATIKKVVKKVVKKPTA